MENKKKLKKRKRIIFITIGVLLFLIMGGVISSKMNGQSLVNLIPNYLKSVLFTASFNPEDERQIGYEFLDDGKVVHIWNTQDDYFFNKSSGIQFTNHYEDYWTRNVFCIGYYSGEEWVKIKCADELENFNREIQTDNLTYVNATLWKDITYTAPNEITYNMRLGINYYLGLNDKNLSITIYGKNIGIDIPFDLGFAWKITDWDIPPSEREDYLKVNNTNYLISSINYDTIFTNMDNTFIKGFDNRESLRVDWNENLNYAVKMFGDGVIENFYIALLINAGTFSAGQEKSTTFYWIDLIGVDDTSDGTDAGTDTLTVQHTTTGTATNGILIVTVQVTDASESDGIIINVTHNGDELTHLAGADADDVIEARTEIWYRANPDVGSNLDIVVTATGSCTDLSLGAISLTGVNNTEITFVVQNATGDSTPPTLDITTLGDSSYVIDSLSSRDPDGTEINPTTAGGISIHDTDVGSDVHASTYVDAGGAGVQTMNYSDVDLDTVWVMSAVAVQALATVEWNQTSLNLGESPNNITSVVEISSFLANTDTKVDCTGNCTQITTNWTQRTMTNGQSDAVLITCSNATEGVFQAVFNVTSDEDTSDNLLTVDCEVFSYGWLNVSIQKPDDNSEWYQNDANLTVNATVICEGGSNAKCGTVEALARYNLTTSPDTAINVTEGGTPFFVVGGEAGLSYWDIVKFEGDGIAENPSSGQRIGDLSSNDAYRMFNMFTTNITLNITKISINIGGTLNGPILPAIVKICNYTDGSDICTVDTCITVNSSFTPLFALGWQNITLETSYNVSPNLNYSVYFESQTDNEGDSDYVTIRTDESATNIRIESWNTGTSCSPIETAYGDIILYAPVTEAEAENPISAGDMNIGDSYQVNWTLNVTTALTVNYLIDVFFNSTTYYPSITENHTEDRTVKLNPSAEDTEAPKWFDNSTNGTIAGTYIEHNVRWTDTGLSGYIFEFDNGTGTFNNDSFVIFTGVNNWSNVTKYVNETVGSTIKWRIYANDTASPTHWNVTDIFQYDTITADTCTPTSPLIANHLFECSDNCIISSVIDGGEYNITLNGTGTFTILANITVDMFIMDTNCQVINLAGDNKELMVV